MPPRRDNRQRFFFRLPKDWLSVMALEAEKRGTNTTAVLRRFITEGFDRLGITGYSKDDFGIFEKKWRVSKDEKLSRLRAKRAEYQRRYRAKVKARPINKAADAANAITWTFHPSGQITTSDLDVLATFVGHVDERGQFTAESTRHSVEKAREKAREAVEAGTLVGERWRLFVGE